VAVLGSTVLALAAVLATSVPAVGAVPHNRVSIRDPLPGRQGEHVKCYVKGYAPDRVNGSAPSGSATIRCRWDSGKPYHVSTGMRLDIEVYRNGSKVAGGTKWFPSRATWGNPSRQRGPHPSRAQFGVQAPGCVNGSYRTRVHAWIFWQPGSTIGSGEAVTSDRAFWSPPLRITTCDAT
jgi:hypothetical protein